VANMRETCSMRAAPVIILAHGNFPSRAACEEQASIFLATAALMPVAMPGACSTA